MLDTNEFWQGLKARIKIGGWQRGGLLLATSVIFPIFETSIASIASAAQEARVAWAVLILLGLLHLFLAGVLILIDWATPEMKLAQAVEVQEKASANAKELRRRESAYRMVRECLTALTRKTCDLPRYDRESGEQSSQAVTPQAQWCQSGFEAGLRPILEVITANISTTLGVSSSRYTIEVPLLPDYMSHIDFQEDQHGLCLRAFTSPTLQRTVADEVSSNESPAVLGVTWGVPNQQHISDTTALFFQNGSPKPQIYFRRFATCPITEACSDTQSGVLLITSMQDEPFADDILDTMQFIASIVSNYVSAYCECFMQSERYKAAKEVVPDLSIEKQKMIAEKFGMWDLLMRLNQTGLTPSDGQPSTTTEKP